MINLSFTILSVFTVISPMFHQVQYNDYMRRYCESGCDFEIPGIKLADCELLFTVQSQTNDLCLKEIDEQVSKNQDFGLSDPRMSLCEYAAVWHVNPKIFSIDFFSKNERLLLRTMNKSFPGSGSSSIAYDFFAQPTVSAGSLDSFLAQNPAYDDRTTRTFVLLVMFLKEREYWLLFQDWTSEKSSTFTELKALSYGN